VEEEERSLLIAAAAIARTAKGGCYLGGDDDSGGGGGGSGGIRTGFKSRRYLLLVAVTSFNSYQFHGHTSLPGRYNGDFGETRATASAANASDKYLIVCEKEVRWTPVEAALMAISSFDPTGDDRFTTLR